MRALILGVFLALVTAAPSLAQTPPCTYDVDASQLHFNGDGGSRGITVRTRPDCPAPVTSAPFWISVATSPPQSLTGYYYVQAQAAPNTDAAPRGSTLDIGGHLVAVTQLEAGRGPLPYLLFWQHQTMGYLSWWRIQGDRLIASGPLTPSRVEDTAWKVLATGDFNDDGHADLFWQHAGTGRMTVWLMDGTRLTDAGLLQPDTVSDPQWAMRAVADMNSDGRPDLLWQHRGDGRIVVWLMNGLRLDRAVALTPSVVADTNWRIVAAKDFNGDGHPDLLWQHSATNVVAVWLMNGTDFVAPGIHSPAPRYMAPIKAIVDVDGDTQSDVIGQGDGVLYYGWDGTVPYSVGPEFVGRVPSPVYAPTPWLIVGPR